MCIKEKMEQDLRYYTELAKAIKTQADRAYAEEDYDAYDALYETFAAIDDVRDALATALGV